MKILLVDDHAIFRDGLKFLLSSLQESVFFSEANSCDQAIKSLNQESFDLMLLDLNLPDSEGVCTLNIFSQAFDTTPIVILSGEDNPLIIHEAIKSGAAGYIPKSSTSKVLTSALQLVLNGGIYLPPNALLSSPQHTPAHSSENIPPSPCNLDSLSERQIDVLKCVLQGKPNKIIAHEMNISESTVKSHLSLAYRSLGVKNRTEAVYTASQLGILINASKH